MLTVDNLSYFPFESQDIVFLKVLPTGETTFEALSRHTVIKLGQEKCLQIFHSAAGALRLRDIRVILPDSTASEPIIVVRMLSCLLNLGTVRALLLPDRLFVIVPDGADELILLIRSKIEELSQGILDSNLTFPENGDEDKSENLEDKSLLANSPIRKPKKRTPETIQKRGGSLID